MASESTMSFDFTLTFKLSIDAANYICFVVQKISPNTKASEIAAAWNDMVREVKIFNEDSSRSDVSKRKSKARGLQVECKWDEVSGATKDYDLVKQFSNRIHASQSNEQRNAVDRMTNFIKSASKAVCFGTRCSKGNPSTTESAHKDFSPRSISRSISNPTFPSTARINIPEFSHGTIKSHGSRQGYILASEANANALESPNVSPRGLSPIPECSSEARTLSTSEDLGIWGGDPDRDRLTVQRVLVAIKRLSLFTICRRSDGLISGDDDHATTDDYEKSCFEEAECPKKLIVASSDRAFTEEIGLGITLPHSDFAVETNICASKTCKAKPVASPAEHTFRTNKIITKDGFDLTPLLRGGGPFSKRKPVDRDKPISRLTWFLAGGTGKTPPTPNQMLDRRNKIIQQGIEKGKNWDGKYWTSDGAWPQFPKFKSKPKESTEERGGESAYLGQEVGVETDARGGRPYPADDARDVPESEGFDVPMTKPVPRKPQTQRNATNTPSQAPSAEPQGGYTAYNQPAQTKSAGPQQPATPVATPSRQVPDTARPPTPSRQTKPSSAKPNNTSGHGVPTASGARQRPSAAAPTIAAPRKSQPAIKKPQTNKIRNGRPPVARSHLQVPGVRSTSKDSQLSWSTAGGLDVTESPEDRLVQGNNGAKAAKTLANVQGNSAANRTSSRQ